MEIRKNVSADDVLELCASKRKRAESAMCSQRSSKCRPHVFRTVKELSVDGEASSGLAALDMNAALKGLVFHDKKSSAPSRSDNSSFTATLSPEICVPGSKPPADFTLKTLVKLACTSSLKWFHRSMRTSTCIGLPEDSVHIGNSSENGHSTAPFPSQILSPKALLSWIYPQHVLPPSVISFYTSTTSGEEGKDLLSKRQVEWEDSFQSLYSIFQQNICNIFYVCTSQYIVMFLGNKSGSQSRSAYISRSTRTLRCLLNKHKVHYSMPLCYRKVEQPTAEDLFELNEIEKENLGQTRRPRPSYEIDGSQESLLAIHGSFEVHGLYNVLLNYRSSMSSSPGADVPLLYSPVPFWNAAISIPQIKCAEMKRVDPSEQEHCNGGSCDGYFSTIEIKDQYIPPWIISRLCSHINTKGINFDLSFVTEHVSIGLNVCLKTRGDEQNKEISQDFQEMSFISGELEAVLCGSLTSGFVKRLKHNVDGYVAFVTAL